jgi:hypothetical protein
MCSTCATTANDDDGTVGITLEQTWQSAVSVHLNKDPVVQVRSFAGPSKAMTLYYNRDYSKLRNELESFWGI